MSLCRIILVFLMLVSTTVCSGQKTSETWKKFTEQFADFELPARDLRIIGSEETITYDDSLTYAGFFKHMKIEKKLIYKTSGQTVRCNLMIYSGQIYKDSVMVNSQRLMEIFKEPFTPEMFQVKREKIEKVGKNVRLNLTITSEGQMGVIEILTWIGDTYLIIVACEGKESEVEYMHKSFKLKSN